MRGGTEAQWVPFFNYVNGATAIYQCTYTLPGDTPMYESQILGARVSIVEDIENCIALSSSLSLSNFMI